MLNPMYIPTIKKEKEAITMKMVDKEVIQMNLEKYGVKKSDAERYIQDGLGKMDDKIYEKFCNRFTETIEELFRNDNWDKHLVDLVKDLREYDLSYEQFGNYYMKKMDFLILRNRCVYPREYYTQLLKSSF